MKDLHRYPYVLTVYPNTRGFAFVVFESALSLVDWGVKEVRGLHKNARCLVKVEDLLIRYAPLALVLQDTSVNGTPRSRRIESLNDAIAEAGQEHGMTIAAYSRREVLAAFAAFDAAKKQDIAEVIAMHIPALARYVPPPRKPWMTEHSRMGLFDAAALALTYFKAIGEAI